MNNSSNEPNNKQTELNSQCILILTYLMQILVIGKIQKDNQ